MSQDITCDAMLRIGRVAIAKMRAAARTKVADIRKEGRVAVIIWLLG